MFQLRSKDHLLSSPLFDCHVQPGRHDRNREYAQQSGLTRREMLILQTNLASQKLPHLHWIEIGDLSMLDVNRLDLPG